MKKAITDHLGNKFESIKKMCDAYGINEKTYHSRINRDKYSLEEALGVMPRIGKMAKDIVVDDKLTILYSIKGDNIEAGIFYHCIDNEEETIMTHTEIVNYYRNNICS